MQVLSDAPVAPAPAQSPSPAHGGDVAPRRARSAGRPLVAPFARALSLLGAFRADDRFLGNQALAARTGLPTSTVTQPLPRVRDLPIDGASAQVAVEARRAQLGARQKLQPVYGAVLQAVAAVGLQFDEALQRERELCQMLVRSSAAHALRYQLDAEEAAISQSDATGGMPRSVQRVAVIGAGTMGSGIAIAALSAGLNVLLLEQDETALARGRERISQFFAERVSTGKLKAAIAAEHECRLSVSIDWARLGEVDLVVEAVFEDLEVKQQVFRQIDAHARPGAILATNTSYLDVDAIASVTSRPQDVLGLHFFSPANVMRLLEVVRGNRTAPEVLATGMEFGLSLKKLPVICGNAFGFIGNRIYNAYRRQCEFMLEDGAWPEDIDGALTAMGFAMGPFAVADLSGLDIAWRMRKAQAATRDPGERYVDILDRLCEAGRLGRKAGAGYYAYGNGKATRISDDTVRSIIEAASLRRGITRRTLTPTEIQRRALLAMVNEVALLLAEGVAGRASDVDVVLVQGYGFPRWHGGPVFWARQQDRDQLELELRRLAQESGPGFVVADLTPVLRSR